MAPLPPPALTAPLTCPLDELFKNLVPDGGRRWEQLLDGARQFMASRRGRKGALIEIAAQHPLAGGLYPGAEFRARLDRGIKLYERYKRRGYDVEIYVPGSRHMDKGVEDIVSLSAAGVMYLANNTIPETKLHGDDLNDRYKGTNSHAFHHGVYCSADECYVASQYFKEKQGFGLLISVLSPHQARRKMLHYLANGVKPAMVWVWAPVLYHDVATEATKNIPHVLELDDPTLQNPKSDLAVIFRKARMAGYSGKTLSTG